MELYPSLHAVMLTNSVKDARCMTHVNEPRSGDDITGPGKPCRRCGYPGAKTRPLLPTAPCYGRNNHQQCSVHSRTLQDFNIFISGFAE